MSKNNCLNCKYEPDWSEPSGDQYKTQSGKCKWNELIQMLPTVYTKVSPKSIIRHSDDSGIYSDNYCKAWEPK